jgi:hypothetical protein
MEDLRFATTNCDGLAVAFPLVEPFGGQLVRKRINPHRAHAPNINVADMRMFAKRMSKRFGWSSALFEV